MFAGIWYRAGNQTCTNNPLAIIPTQHCTSNCLLIPFLQYPRDAVSTSLSLWVPRKFTKYGKFWCQVDMLLPCPQPILDHRRHVGNRDPGAYLSDPCRRHAHPTPVRVRLPLALLTPLQSDQCPSPSPSRLTPAPTPSPPTHTCPSRRLVAKPKLPMTSSAKPCP